MDIGQHYKITGQDLRFCYRWKQYHEAHQCRWYMCDSCTKPPAVQLKLLQMTNTMEQDKQQLCNRFAAAMRQKREQYGWSYSRLSQASGVNRAQLSRIESGQHAPRLDIMCRICNALSMQIIIPTMQLT